LIRITDKLDKANISVILLNARPYNKYNATINIGMDKKWLAKNKISFVEADLPKLEQILEFRRTTGARFIPHMILTDESKTIINEGFDVKWLKENAL
ncbi:MAG: hypothetical protein KAS23_05435, partial [Anaerohalosphaera sp.]|nr:hypothetical protein [Anaerohalosphaera sp.]